MSELERAAELVIELCAVVARYDLPPDALGKAVLSVWLECQALETSDEAIRVFASDINCLQRLGELR